jgi:ubiquinol-cytochrome c reductase cytochrome c subunit
VTSTRPHPDGEPARVQREARTTRPPRRRPLATALLFAVGLSVMGALYTVVSSTGSAQAASSASDPQQLARGRQLFLEGCSSCHGLNAQGGSAPGANLQSNSISGPTLIGVGAAAVDFQVGTGRMPLAQPGAQAPRRVVTYTQEQIDDLSAYIASLAPGPPIPSAEDLDTSGADLQAGGELFRTNCAQCHNFSGQGGALSNAQFAPSLKVATSKEIWEAMITGPESMPVFSNNTVTPDDKRDIITYIDTMRSQPNPGGAALGRLGPVTEGLFVWVVGLGVVTAVAVWIGAKAS